MNGDQTRFSLFTEGDELFESMLRDISSASKSILFEVYIFRSDRVGQRFLDAFAGAAGRGVDVRARLDAFGSWGTFPGSAHDALRRAGVQLKWYGRWSWRHPFRYGRRDHRKLLVVDGEVAYLGGFNVGEESSRTSIGRTRWRDTHLRFTGRLASRAEQLFHDFEERRECGKEEWVDGSLLLPNYGVGCRYRWHCVLRQHLGEATKRIWITTPYFVPDAATQRGLRNAALRGVDVRLLVPGKSDVSVVQWAARLSYDSLLGAGVKVFEFGGRVLHAKTIVIDDDWASVGTSNLDYRSLFINDELNLVTRSSRLNHELADVFLDDLEHARRVVQKPRGKISLLRFAQGLIGWAARKWL